MVFLFLAIRFAFRYNCTELLSLSLPLRLEKHPLANLLRRKAAMIVRILFRKRRQREAETVLGRRKHNVAGFG